MINDALFSAKILLFGEYGIIEDSMGLSIPFNHFCGALKFSKSKSENDIDSNLHLNNFAQYLEKLQNKGELLIELDLAAFNSDIAKGMYFDSSIPKGFGIGSSGALCASVYHKYAVNKIVPENAVGKQIVLLKKIFAQLESYFHGKSSGLDPLICYLNLPVLVKSSEDINTVGLPEPNADGKGAIFIMNSGTPGQTQSMVTIFMDKCKNQGFRNLIRTEFKKYNDLCIEAFLKKDTKPLFVSLKELSSLVFEHFQPMIPEVFRKLWAQGIETNAYYLKLCGSGGGGYILGFAKNFDEALPYLKKHNPQVIYKF